MLANCSEQDNHKQLILDITDTANRALALVESLQGDPIPEAAEKVAAENSKKLADEIRSLELRSRNLGKPSKEQLEQMGEEICENCDRAIERLEITLSEVPEAKMKKVEDVLRYMLASWRALVKELEL